MARKQAKKKARATSSQIVRGDIQMVIDYKDGRQELREFPNTVVSKGRQALALCLANQIGSNFNFYITKMLFGDGGTLNGVKKYVTSDRNGLFGTTRVTKPVLATIDSAVPTQVTFTAVLLYTDAVGVVLNEMALQLSTGDLFSMRTFSDFTKTEDQQITMNWSVTFV